MYVKETYLPVRRRKRRKRFPVTMIEDDDSSSFYLFTALNADNIKKYKADLKCNPKKKKKREKIKSTVCFEATPVDLKKAKENRKKNKKHETKRKEGAAAVKKYKFFQPEVKTFNDVTFSPNTTFDRLLRSSRKPLVNKNSVVNANRQAKGTNSALLSPSHCLSMVKGVNRTSTPILISPIFPAVAVCNKQRSKVHDLNKDRRNNLLTPVLRNSIESTKKSSRNLSSVLSASCSTFSPSPLLCNEDDAVIPKVLEFLESDVRNSRATANLGGKIVAHKCEDSFCSPVVTRSRNSSSTENENISYKITHAKDYSKTFSGIKMRLRRATASANKGHNNTESTFNPDESFFSSFIVRNKRENSCNKVEGTQSSDDLHAQISTRSKNASVIEDIQENSMVVQKYVANCFPPCESKSISSTESISGAYNSDERSGIDSVSNKRENYCNVDEIVPSSVKIKRKRSLRRYHTRSHDQSHEKYFSPLSQQNKRGTNCVDTKCDGLKCGQLHFASTWQSPDMFSSADEIESDTVPFKCVAVVEKYNPGLSACNSNDEDASSKNGSSSCKSGDYSQECLSSSINSFNVSVLVKETEFLQSIPSLEVEGKSDLVRKSTGDMINLSSRVNSMVDLSSSVHAGLSDKIIASAQNPDRDNIVNKLCTSKNKNFKNYSSYRATGSITLSDTPEVNHCSRSTRKSALSCSDAAAVSSPPSDSEMGTANILTQAACVGEEMETLSSVSFRTADSNDLDFRGGQSLTHNLSVICEENASKLHCNRSRRSSLCRRLSHLVIPERRTRGSSNSCVSLAVSDKSVFPLSVSVVLEEEEEEDDDDDELVPGVDLTFTRGLVSARDMVLGRCNQSEPHSFEKAFPPRFFDNCKKIGEGLYGEVFFCQYNSTTGTVLKIIPIEGHILVNGEKQKKYNEVASELVIAMELSNLRHDAQFKTSCFVEVVRCVCVQGKYPQRLIDLWNDYHDEKVSENDSPTIFDDGQLFLIFELANGGQGLESYCFTSAAQAFSAFIQLTFALAVAEVTLEFEHRDLHWGNVLIQKTTTKIITFTLNGKQFLVPSNGIQVTIIDYTLSRMSYGGCCIFNDLAVDPDLFISQGDYQFEVYRLMQSALRNEWKNFRPYTNILWLHYILGKMLHGVHYKNISTKIHKKFKTKLSNCHSDVLKYNSAYELVTTGNLLETMK